MSVIMELLKRFNLGFAISDYISGFLSAGRGMQSDDHESFFFFRSLAGNVSRLMP